MIPGGLVLGHLWGQFRQLNITGLAEDPAAMKQCCRYVTVATSMPLRYALYSLDEFLAQRSMADT